MDHDTRTVKHYRDHEMVAKVEFRSDGWEYVIQVLEHQGDDDRLRCKERSATRYPSDIAALHAAQVRGREIVDALID